MDRVLFHSGVGNLYAKGIFREQFAGVCQRQPTHYQAMSHEPFTINNRLFRLLMPLVGYLITENAYNKLIMQLIRRK